MSPRFVDEGTRPLRSLPTNIGFETRVVFFLDGHEFNEPVSEALAARDLHRASPVRRFYAWPGKRNYEGRYWSSTAGGHVPFESFLERQFLESADFDSKVVGLAAQPLALLWPKSTPGQRGHVPDFLVKLESGDSRLVDVKAPSRVDASANQFALTRKVCQAVGWQYEIFTGLDEPRAANVSWLGAYRFERYQPDPETTLAAVEVFTGGVPLRVGVTRLTAAARLDREVAHGQVLHLIHAGVLVVDMDTPLSLGSMVGARDA